MNSSDVSISLTHLLCSATHSSIANLRKTFPLPSVSLIPALQPGQNPPEDSSGKSSSTSIFIIALTFSCAVSCVVAAHSLEAQSAPTPQQCKRAVQGCRGKFEGIQPSHDVTVRTGPEGRLVHPCLRIYFQSEAQAKCFSVLHSIKLQS